MERPDDFKYGEIVETPEGKATIFGCDWRSFEEPKWQVIFRRDDFTPEEWAKLSPQKEGKAGGPSKMKWFSTSELKSTGVIPEEGPQKGISLRRKAKK